MRKLVRWLLDGSDFPEPSSPPGSLAESFKIKPKLMKLICNDRFYGENIMRSYYASKKVQLYM
jgi:hypothetical protein